MLWLWLSKGGGGELRNGEQPRPCSGKVLLAVKSLPRWTKHDALQMEGPEANDSRQLARD